MFGDVRVFEVKDQKAVYKQGKCVGRRRGRGDGGLSGTWVQGAGARMQRGQRKIFRNNMMSESFLEPEMRAGHQCTGCIKCRTRCDGPTVKMYT